MEGYPAECDELRFSLQRLRALLDALVVRGLRACGADELGQLELLAGEFERCGAARLAAALLQLATAARAGERRAAEALLRAQAMERMVERLLTLRVIDAVYGMALADAGESVEGEDEA